MMHDEPLDFPIRDSFIVAVPLNLWRDKSLTPTEKMLLCEVAFLGGIREKGCFASNAYLASVIGCGEGAINNCLTALRKKGFIKTIAFDGRRRVLRCLHPALMALKLLTSNDVPSCIKQCSETTSNDVPFPLDHPYIDKGVDKIVDKVIGETPTSLTSKSVEPWVSEDIGRQAPSDGRKAIEIRSKVKLTPKQLKTLQEKHSAADLDLMLDKLNTYKEETGKVYKSDCQAIYRWVEEWLHNDKAQKAMDEKKKARKIGDSKKNIAIYEDLRGSLEYSTRRSLLCRNDQEAYDEVLNRRCRLDDPNFGKKLHSWYGYEYTEENND